MLFHRFHRSAWTRALAFGLAAALALILVATAGHHHAAGTDTHACAVCAVLMPEAPGADGLPAPLARAFAPSYPLQRAIAHASQYRRTALLPPSCGPPANLRD